MHPRTATLTLTALLHATTLSAAPAGGPSLARATAGAGFEVATGGTLLVHDEEDLPEGPWFELTQPVPAARRGQVEALLVREAAKYPPGFLAAIGLKAVGVFAGLASAASDGYRPWDEGLGGYRYYGRWNGRDAIIMAWYSDAQVALTFHHEVFHHVDAVISGRIRKNAFDADDSRFVLAISGEEPYEAAPLDPALLRRLRAISGEERLEGAVSAYCEKNAGEDQAETARWLMTNLAAGLVQAAEAPELPGSQRILHLLAAYREASPTRGPVMDANWLARVALGDPTHEPARLAARPGSAGPRDPVELHLRPEGAFVVRGREGPDGVNRTLQADLLAVPSLARAAPDPQASTRHALSLLAAYEAFIASRWTLSASTRAVFSRVRAELGAEGTPAPSEVQRNPHSAKVDAAISDKALRAVIHRVQPSTVRLTRQKSGGSGVVIGEGGLVLTAGHVAPTLGGRLSAELPDGRRFEGVTTAVDRRLDLSLVQLSLPRAVRLPAASLSERPPQRGDRVVVIGQPGRFTPDGEETGYQPFHVSVGAIRQFAQDRLAAQGLGGTGHDAWTYWGHSGSPLFDDRGHIVALHNSWDSKTAMRHAVTWEALVDFLARARP